MAVVLVQFEGNTVRILQGIALTDLYHTYIHIYHSYLCMYIYNILTYMYTVRPVYIPYLHVYHICIYIYTDLYIYIPYLHTCIYHTYMLYLPHSINLRVYP